MRRREFLGVLGGAAAWPLTARAQQSRAMHRVGILIGAADDSEFRPRVHVFVETLRGLGWKDGENVSIDIRWNPGGPQQTAALARELLALKPDVILAGPTRALIPLQKETSTIPIVFISVSDPLGQGIVKSLARPTGNLTGFRVGFESHEARPIRRTRSMTDAA